MNIDIVKASQEHLQAIAEFNQQMALETENKELPTETILAGVRKMFEDESLGFYLVALDEEGNVLGCLGVTFEWSDWRNGLFWWIQSVYVGKGHRSKGVFSKMYAAVKSQAQSQMNVCGIRLYVEKDNKTAYRTYVRLGMIETEYHLMEEEFGS